MRVMQLMHQIGVVTIRYLLSENVTYPIAQYWNDRVVLTI